MTCDTDVYQGKSKAEIIKTENETALFRGFLDTDVPEDGVTKNAGYANIRAPVNMRSFKRQKSYDWSDYTHLLLKVRGDGRAYSLVLAMERYFDIQWNDVYQYPLYTRGGPYWQIAKVIDSLKIISYVLWKIFKYLFIVNRSRLVSFFWHQKVEYKINSKK